MNGSTQEFWTKKFHSEFESAAYCGCSYLIIVTAFYFCKTFLGGLSRPVILIILFIERGNSICITI